MYLPAIKPVWSLLINVGRTFLILIDFEKAFDSISWNFLNNILKFFNFGESIKKWVKTFYNNIKSAVNQGGNLSEFFRIERGCSQGDPLSPYLFILCAEIIAIKIRENPKIKGIKVLHSEHEISQFADDTSVILDGSEESLNETLLELEIFVILEISTSKFIPRTVNVVFPQERFQFSHSLSLLYCLLPIQITCVFQKIILRPDIFLNHSNSKSVSFNESSDPSKIIDVSSAD
jgi:hypothetical protein